MKQSPIIKKQLNKKKDYAYSYLNLGVLYRDKEFVKEAIDIFTDGITNNVESVFLYYNRACCYHKINFDKKAEDDIIEVLKLQPHMNKYIENDKELQLLINASETIKKLLNNA